MGAAVGLCVFQKDAKLAIQSALDVLSVLSEYSRLGSKVRKFLGREDMLLQSLNGRDPRRFADERCYSFYLGLNGR